MPLPRPAPPWRLPLWLLPLLLSACGPIVQLGGPSGPPPAQHVLTVPPAPSAAPQEPVDPAGGVTVLALSAPAMLQTARIPVQVGETEVRYLVGHAWTEPPARLLGQLLSGRLAADGVPLIDRRVTGRSAGHVLGGELAEFGVDARGRPRVRVRLEATLSGPDGVRRRSFSREAPLAAVEGPAAAAALNAASAALSAEVAAWVAAATRPRGEDGRP